MPARSTRSLQGFVANTLFATPNRTTIRRNSAQSHAVLPVFLIIAFAMMASYFFLNVVSPALTKSDQWDRWESFVGALSHQSSVVPSSVDESKGYDIVYNPPFKLDSLDSQQRQVFDLFDDVPNHPERYHLDLLGLPSSNLTYNEQQVFDALGPTEGSMRQFNDDGSVVISEYGCLGALQGCDFNICPEEFWRELYTNIWCGAKAFKEQLRMWDGNFAYAVAGYKSAWQYSRDADGNHILDENGNWIILRDDAGNPKIEKEYQEQVDRVFNNLTLVPRQ